MLTDTYEGHLVLASSLHWHLLQLTQCLSLAATGHHDRRVRLWDPKAPETAMQGEVLGAKGGGSHNGWVTAVAWCPTSEYHLTSCAMDGELKV